MDGQHPIRVCFDMRNQRTHPVENLNRTLGHAKPLRVGEDDERHNTAREAGRHDQQALLFQPPGQHPGLALHLSSRAGYVRPCLTLALLPGIAVALVGTAPGFCFDQKDACRSDNEQVDLGEVVGLWLDNDVVEDDPGIGEPA